MCWEKLDLLERFRVLDHQRVKLRCHDGVVQPVVEEVVGVRNSWVGMPL